MRIDIRKIWSEQESSSNKQVLRKRVSSIKSLDCYIGLVGYTGVKMFQLEVESTVKIHKNYLQRFRGVEMQVIPTEDGALKKFAIILIEKELTDIFILFVEDIIDNLISISSTTDALNIINQRVSYWRKLFAKASGELLSIERQRGLFGELFVLNLLLDNSEDNKLILNSWVGSQSANQDFAIGKNAIEVKTSKATNPSINISNEHQLDYTSWNHIYLCIVMVNESSGRDGTLYELISTIREILGKDEELIADFDRKIALAGINPDMVTEYDEISYSVRNYRFYHVREGFPVIIEGTLENDAIHNVKYQIEINQCKDFEEDEETVLNLVL